MKNKKKMCFGVIIGTRAYFNSELAKERSQTIAGNTDKRRV